MVNNKLVLPKTSSKLIYSLYFHKKENGTIEEKHLGAHTSSHFIYFKR